MPSVPQSLLWISLVVLWLFVLVPMLVSKRDAVRRTSDVALATRVLNGASSSRRLRRGGPAVGHRSDPEWKASDEEDLDDDLEESDDSSDDSSDGEQPRKAVVVAEIEAEPDYLDVDVVEESGALPAAEEPVAEEPAPEPEPVAEVTEEAEPELADDEYELVEDTSGLEPEPEPEEPVRLSPAAARRQRNEAKNAAMEARKYRSRKRMVTVMMLLTVVSGVAAFLGWSMGWWVLGTLAAATMMYLGYLRRQTRIEAKLRQRRAQRMARARVGVANTEDRAYDVTPSRLRRPGAVVLEIDDEDPIFEHLDYAPGPFAYDLPRASGQ